MLNANEIKDLLMRDKSASTKRLILFEYTDESSLDQALEKYSKMHPDIQSQIVRMISEPAPTQGTSEWDRWLRQQQQAIDEYKVRGNI